MDKVSVLLIDKTWLEGTYVDPEDYGVWLKNVARSRDGEVGFAHVGESVFVPWSSILFLIGKE
ncbi:MAG: hypothetical protein ABIH46_06760 [Chloroflexota bacterium]